MERYSVGVERVKKKKYVCSYHTEPDWGGKIMERYPPAISRERLQNIRDRVETRCITALVFDVNSKDWPKKAQRKLNEEVDGWAEDMKDLCNEVARLAQIIYEMDPGRRAIYDATYRSNCN